MNTSILLIEDDPNIIDLMEIILEKNRYKVFIAQTGMEALNIFQLNSIDLVLLDLGLPDVDGIDLLKIFRKRLTIPIIVISARNNENEKVKALDLGADDYVTKPFGINELLARIRMTRRRYELPDNNLTIVKNKDLVINFQKRLVYIRNKEIHLTKNEFQIIALLFRQLGRVVTYQTIISEVWGPYADDSQTLRVNMSNIRKKIEMDTLNPEYLITEIGVGYRLREYPLDN